MPELPRLTGLECVVRFKFDPPRPPFPPFTHFFTHFNTAIAISNSCASWQEQKQLWGYSHAATMAEICEDYYTGGANRNRLVRFLSQVPRFKPTTVMSKPTCRLVTLGCKVNQYETELVKEALVRGGYREAGEDDVADLCVVNTCTVTATGDSKGRQLIRQLARKNPGTRTIVTGCYATREPEALRDLPGVWEVVEDKRELPDVLTRVGVNDFPNGISTFQGRRRAYVKVQDGCILNCTYCIIPAVRPGLRSRPPEDIADEVRRLIDNGHKEIVLCGIHLGHYGVDATRGRSGKAPFRLAQLIEKLDRIPGDWRMRLSSIEAAEISPDFVDVVSGTEKLCPHFHPSLQSGSRDVLLRMKRRYSLDMFQEKIELLRERTDNPAFSTDVIVGFPGETDEDFEQTLAVCEQAGFMRIHVFPFSPRKGTPAAGYPDQVPPEIKQERGRRLAELGERLALRYYESLLGRDLSLLVERTCDDRPGWVSGTSCRYTPMELPAEAGAIGSIVPVTALSATVDGIEAGVPVEAESR